MLTKSILYSLSVFCNSKIKIRSIDQNIRNIFGFICILYTINRPKIRGKDSLHTILYIQSHTGGKSGKNIKNITRYDCQADFCAQHFLSECYSVSAVRTVYQEIMSIPLYPESCGASIPDRHMNVVRSWKRYIMTAAVLLSAGRSILKITGKPVLLFAGVGSLRERKQSDEP